MTTEEAYAEADAKSRQAVADYHQQRWLQLCPPIYDQPIDFSRIDPKNHKAIRSILEWKQYPTGLFIIGATGRAKTRACWQSLKPRFFNGETIFHARSWQLSQDAQRCTMDVDSGRDILNRYVKPSILFLDDLGKRTTPVTSQFLFEILEGRTSSGKPVMITSNETSQTLGQAINEETLSEPLIRRLSEFCQKIVLR